MATPNFQNRTLFHGDNLPILQGMNSETVDLIATDPPFNKGRDFHATPDSLAKNARFQDRWSWDRDVHEAWTDAIQDDYPAVWSVIQFARASYGDDMGAFLCFMGVRLMEMERVLKPAGSVYLHCDPTASHYLKAMMDAVFGRRNFRNEIVWRKYAGRKNNAKRKFSTQHEIIFYYVKTDKAAFNVQYLPISEKEIAKKYKYVDDDGRRYRLAWGRRYQLTGEQRRIYLDEQPGAAIGGLWVEDGLQLNTSSSERTGYPTQKPLALYERIIKASSNPGDMVLDPFAGCATTVIAAERLGRRWAGIDIWDGAHQMVVDRLAKESEVAKDAPAPSGGPQGRLAFEVHYTRDAPERTDEGDEAAPILRLRVQRIVEAWQKLSRRQMTGMLGEAQANGEGLIVCAGCGRAMEVAFMELDHIQPKSERGSNAINNRILLCGPCNREKGAKRTLSGLIDDNRKSGWTVDSTVADAARVRADRMAERVELEWDSSEIQALVEKHK